MAQREQDVPEPIRRLPAGRCRPRSRSRRRPRSRARPDRRRRSRPSRFVREARRRGAGTRPPTVGSGCRRSARAASARRGVPPLGARGPGTTSGSNGRRSRSASAPGGLPRRAGARRRQGPDPGRRPRSRAARAGVPERLVRDDHARHRDRARTARLRAGRQPLPSDAGRRHVVVASGRRAPPIPTTPTACCASRNSSCSCSRRGPRGRASSTPSDTSCGGSVVAVSSRSPCGPACRSCRSRWSAPRSRCRPVRSPVLAKAAGPPVRTDHGEHAGPRTTRAVGYFPAKFKPAGARPGAFETSTRPGAVLAQRIMDESETIRDRIQNAALRHAAGPSSVLFGDGCSARRPMTTTGRRRMGTAGAGHRARHVLGRTGRAGPQGGPRRRRDRRARHRRADGRLERTEYVRVDENYTILARIVKAAQSTRSSTRSWWSIRHRCPPATCTK